MPLTEKPDACLVLVTCGNLGEAETIARSIVTEKLAACVNLIGGKSPVRSFYVWEEKLQEEDEVLLIVKTRPLLLERLEDRVRELHSYEVFEFLTLSIQTGSSNYVNWLMAETTGK